jgi:hypothetical protein
MRATVLALLFLGLALALQAGAATRPSFPFAPGERLTYAISWTVVPAGTAVLEVLPVEQRDGQPVLRFRGTARSNPFVDSFYKVRTTIDSETDFGLTRDLRYHSDQNEGSFHKEAVVEFHWDLARAVRSIRGETRHELFIWPRGGGGPPAPRGGGGGGRGAPPGARPPLCFSGGPGGRPPPPPRPTPPPPPPGGGGGPSRGR